MSENLFSLICHRLRRLPAVLAVLLTVLLVPPARAELTITVEGVGASTLPLTITPFASEKATLDRKALTPIIQADLARTGAFRFIPPAAGKGDVNENTPVVWGDWQARGVQAALVGSVSVSGQQVSVQFRLYDTVRQQTLVNSSLRFTPDQYRQAAHQIADIVYEKLTGQKGDFNSQIAYVLKRSKRYELHVADADGQQAVSVLASSEPIMSPAWSPDGLRLAYVSFERQKAVVYVHVVATGARRAVAEFRGNNSAPAWSPDGKSLALALTRDGLSQVYVMDAGGGTPRRLTTSNGIDTEPVWSPDGQWIYFTSDRGGSPQIYRVAASGGDARRVTFEGSYNVSPDISPDGRSLAFIRQEGGRYRLMLQDIASGVATALTNTGDDESPSFSPNGRTILYATREGRRDVLAAVSIDGSVRQRLTLPTGDVREPAWGPPPAQ